MNKNKNPPPQLNKQHQNQTLNPKPSTPNRTVASVSSGTDRDGQARVYSHAARGRGGGGGAPGLDALRLRRAVQAVVQVERGGGDRGLRSRGVVHGVFFPHSRICGSGFQPVGRVIGPLFA